jgi:hypothetical protein
MKKKCGEIEKFCENDSDIFIASKDQYNIMQKSDGRDFCVQWLDAWSKQQLVRLCEMYADHTIYIDPSKPDGIHGKDALKVYFQKLFVAFPKWAWTLERYFPIETGFIVKYRATIQVGPDQISFFGMDIVELEWGKIIRNEVYFDRSTWLAALKPSKK